jgi:hypothetical protein
VRYFGEDWDVPATQGQEQTPTPVGKSCGYCTVPIQDDDRGFLMQHLTGREGAWQTAEMPWHRECLLRSTVGGPDHLEGRCTCHGGDAPQGTVTGPQMRAEALAVWDRLHAGHGAG